MKAVAGQCESRFHLRTEVPAAVKGGRREMTPAGPPFTLRSSRFPSRVRIAHDNAFAAASWHVASVEVREVRSGRCWAFPSDVWLSARQGDQRATAGLLFFLVGWLIVYGC